MLQCLSILTSLRCCRLPFEKELISYLNAGVLNDMGGSPDWNMLGDATWRRKIQTFRPLMQNMFRGKGFNIIWINFPLALAVLAKKLAPSAEIILRMTHRFDHATPRNGWAQERVRHIVQRNPVVLTGSTFDTFYTLHYACRRPTNFFYTYPPAWYRSATDERPLSENFMLWWPGSDNVGHDEKQGSKARIFEAISVLVTKQSQNPSTSNMMGNATSKIHVFDRPSHLRAVGDLSKLAERYGMPKAIVFFPDGIPAGPSPRESHCHLIHSLR